MAQLSGHVALSASLLVWELPCGFTVWLRDAHSFLCQLVYLRPQMAKADVLTRKPYRLVGGMWSTRPKAAYLPSDMYFRETYLHSMIDGEAHRCEYLTLHLLAITREYAESCLINKCLGPVK